MSVAPNRTRTARLVAYAVIQNIIIKGLGTLFGNIAGSFIRKK